MIPTFGRYIPDSADAVNNVSEEMTQLPASKKIRYAHDDDEEIPSKVSEAFDYSSNFSEEIQAAMILYFFFIHGDQNQFLWSLMFKLG